MLQQILEKGSDPILCVFMNMPVMSETGGIEELAQIIIFRKMKLIFKNHYKSNSGQNSPYV